MKSLACVALMLAMFAVATTPQLGWLPQAGDSTVRSGLSRYRAAGSASLLVYNRSEGDWSVAMRDWAQLQAVDVSGARAGAFTLGGSTIGSLERQLACRIGQSASMPHSALVHRAVAGRCQFVFVCCRGRNQVHAPGKLSEV